MIFAVILFYFNCVSFFVLCGVYVGATRLVHGHHEKIAARPCKESRISEDGRKHVFALITSCILETRRVLMISLVEVVG